MSPEPDLVILGAGIAGLSAALALSRVGLDIILLEARDRVGGRIFTQWDDRLNVPVELGAEFIHGCPREIWDLLREINVTARKLSGENWCFLDGRLRPCDFFGEVDQLFEKMDERAPDESFLSFVQRCCPDPRFDVTKRWATGYVTGFHGADPAQISVHSIVRGARADEEVQAERGFRISGGYRLLADYFAKELQARKVPIHLQTVVRKVRWQEGSVSLVADHAEQEVLIRAPRVLITLPLAVLQASQREMGAVHFLPELPAVKQRALQRLAMGKVMRVVLRFRERFWNDLRPPHFQKPLSDLRFLFSQQPWFPTWWTTMPDKLPLLTAWAPFLDAQNLSGQSESYIVDRALQTIATLFGMSSHQLAGLFEKAYWHDWEQDPYSRGAYSYVKVGGELAQHDLGVPVGDTLFFAGEATDTSGHNGTVHGALASAQRVVHEILKSAATMRSS